jgi:hypothetical protein
MQTKTSPLGLRYAGPHPYKESGFMFSIPRENGETLANITQINIVKDIEKLLPIFNFLFIIFLDYFFLITKIALYPQTDKQFTVHVSNFLTLSI